MSELPDLVKFFASFLNFSFRYEDSLRRKIFTSKSYSYEFFLNVFAHSETPSIVQFLFTKLADIKLADISIHFLITSLVTSLVFILVVKLKKAANSLTS